MMRWTLTFEPMSCFRFGAISLWLLVSASPLWAEEPRSQEPSDRETSLEILSDQQWERLDETVDNGLKFLATQQEDDGSFPTLPHAKPGITSVAVYSVGSMK